MDKDDNKNNSLSGFEELNIEIPSSVKLYAGIVYGILKEADRLLEFKASEHFRNEFIDLMEKIIEYSGKMGMQYQKEMDNAKITDLQMQLDTLIKKENRGNG